MEGSGESGIVNVHKVANESSSSVVKNSECDELDHQLSKVSLSGDQKKSTSCVNMEDNTKSDSKVKSESRQTTNQQNVKPKQMAAPASAKSLEQPTSSFPIMKAVIQQCMSAKLLVYPEDKDPHYVEVNVFLCC